MIPYGRQDISEADLAAVVEVLQSDFLTQGPAVPMFESALKQACGADQVVAVNSATSALHIACLALGVGPGDRVWTSPVTFVASANAARYCGADVDFVDIDPLTFNMSVERLAAKLEGAAAAGSLPKVVVPVDMCGQPCNLAGIRALADRYGFKVLEDASHAVGARYRGEPVGNGRYSDIAIFSFHPVKIVTTAEGGAAVTNDPGLASHMRRLRSHGITRDPNEMTRPSDGPWYYEQIDLGFNYRMTDLQAALGVSQMTRLEEFLDRRHAIADRYDELLADLPIACPRRDPDSYSALHLYVVRIAGADAVRHRRVFERMREGGVGVNLHYIPVYLQPYYRALGFRPGLCPEAEQYYREAISLPMYPTLTGEQQLTVVRCLKEALAP